MARWHPMRDDEELSRSASSRILDAAARSIQRRGLFRIVVSGGRTPRATHRLLADADADWERWEVWFADERCLPEGERNADLVARDWLARLAIPGPRVHAIPAGLGPRSGAATYSDLLRDAGEFDLVLLGLGEDGHTASLFPGHDWGTEPDAPAAIPVFDSPKPPLERVTLTVARLNRTREALFLVAGEGKREAVARWRAGEPLPAAAVRPASGVDVFVAI